MVLSATVLGLPMLSRQGLTREFRQHLPSRALLASGPLLDSEQDVVVETDGGAHARDASASPGSAGARCSRAPDRGHRGGQRSGGRGQFNSRHGVPAPWSLPRRGCRRRLDRRIGSECSPAPESGLLRAPLRTHPPVVLLHGGPGLWDYLAPLAEMLCELTVSYRYDQRGCGNSSPGDELSMARYIDDLHELIESWEHEQIVIIGHSFGATLALAGALYPDRVARSLTGWANSLPGLPGLDRRRPNGGSCRGPPTTPTRSLASDWLARLPNLLCRSTCGPTVRSLSPTPTRSAGVQPPPVPSPSSMAQRTRVQSRTP